MKKLYDAPEAEKAQSTEVRASSVNSRNNQIPVFKPGRVMRDEF